MNSHGINYIRVASLVSDRPPTKGTTPSKKQVYPPQQPSATCVLNIALPTCDGCDKF